ncbi:MAG: GIY-YIG nuclease family protein [Rhodanobacter sp.]
MIATPPTASPPPLSPKANGTWCLYLIECRNGSWYAGITNRLAARYAAHVAGRGARYTRANPPLRLLGSCPYPDRASASRAEWAIRQLPREKKLAFLQGDRSDAADPSRVGERGPDGSESAMGGG